MSNFELGSPTTGFIDDKRDTQIDRPIDSKTEANEGSASDDQMNTEQLSSSNPRSASGESSETFQTESHYDDSEPYRFAPSGHSYSPHNPNDQKIKEIEQLEQTLARMYFRMHGPNIDTDAVLQETKNRAMSDYSYKAHLEKLDELYHYRCHLARPREPRSENGRPSEYSMGSRAPGDLGVPPEHVHCLFNKQATRAEILRALSNFYTDARIHRGDIIIIYFAGHGASYLCSKHHENEFGERVQPLYSAIPPQCCPVEAICPVDRGDDGGQYPSGKIPDISDREINAHLSRLFRDKEHRITVILDCCHSGGATREGSDAVVRSLPPLPRAVYDDMRSQNSGSSYEFSSWIPYVSDEEWKPDMRCHVLIAACRGDQTSVERDNTQTGIFHGIFTRVLVATLRQRSSEQLTYKALLDALPVRPLRWQTPVVAGEAKGNLLWSQEDHETITGPAASTFFLAGNAQSYRHRN
ncbi:hypothetical protein F5146DRAFT_1228749 [Armillaria mellea]|nr:hypothetical protein F5146DRAFT_1228749 [Armillaria mellea]